MNILDRNRAQQHWFFCADVLGSPVTSGGTLIMEEKGIVEEIRSESFIGEAIESHRSKLVLNDDRILICEHTKENLILTEPGRVVNSGEIERQPRPWYRIFERRFRLVMKDEYWMTSTGMGVHSLEYHWNGVVIGAICSTEDGGHRRVELSERRESFDFIFECPDARFVVTDSRLVLFQFSEAFGNVAPLIAAVLWRFSYRMEESSRRA